MIKLRAFIFLFLFSWQANAQSAQAIDSLRRNIDNYAQPDSARVKAIVAYVVDALTNNTSDFLPYLNEVISISKKTNYTRGLQKGFMIGQIYFSDRGEYEKSFLYADS